MELAALRAVLAADATATATVPIDAALLGGGRADGMAGASWPATAPRSPT